MGASMASAIATTNKINCPCPLLFELLLYLLDEPPILNWLRKKISEIKTILPSIIPAIVINSTSRLIMCEISWAITPCNSSRFNLASRPEVTATADLFGFLPVAKAFGAASLII